MDAKKYQVFISSTFADLKDERQAAMNAVIDLRHIPIGMEGFPAIDQEQMNYIKRLIDECDYYVLIIKERYGSKSPTGISYTEQEYDYAASKGKHILGFLSTDFDAAKSDDPGAIEAFRSKVSTNRIIKFWTDKSSLELAVVKSLSTAFEIDPREGWVRANSAIDPRTLNDLEASRRTIAELKEQLAQSTAIDIPNLAGLDDEMLLLYEYKKGFDSGRAGGSLGVTWRELFLGVASRFRVGHTYKIMDRALEEFLEHHGKYYYQIFFTEAHRLQILNQFELLGLMKSWPGKATDNTYNVFHVLTEMGEALRKAGLAVRVSP